MNADKMDVEELLSDESFINYCKGTSQEDIAFWENYVKENPGRNLLVKDAKEKYIQLLNALAYADLGEQLTRLTNSLDQEEAAPVIQMDQFEKRNRGRLVPLLLKVTAAAMLLAGLFFTVNYFVSGRSGVKAYVAAYGERKNIQLPDGSVVTLNAGSNIEINKNYGLTTRDVYLEGEAFFEVKHDTSLPFIVHTPAMDVKALGTAFNVKAYLDERITETTLITGIVEVTLKEDNNLKMLLYPNQKIEWNRLATITGNNYATEKGIYLNATDSLKKNLALTNTGNIKEIAWKDNKLIFDNERFEDIAVLLERWYGATINFEDNTVRNYRYTGGFEKEDMKTVLDFLKESKSFSYTIEEDNSININLSK